MAENATPEGDRIAKVLSRRGVSSRREAERLIEAGEVKVNGKIITSPALNVTDADKITISGHPLPDLEPARLWLYYKPEGLVTSASDLVEAGRISFPWDNCWKPENWTTAHSLRKSASASPAAPPWTKHARAG